MPIVTTIEGKIAQIAIDRPEKRNTLNSELCKDLAREFLELNDDTRVRSIVLCGHNNVFCAGLDIEEQLAENTQIFSEFQKVIDALDALSKPIVAAVSGPAVGQGAAMLYHCDLVFAGEHALFSMPGLALGQTPALRRKPVGRKERPATKLACPETTSFRTDFCCRSCRYGARQPCR